MRVSIRELSGGLSGEKVDLTFSTLAGLEVHLSNLVSRGAITPKQAREIRSRVLRRRPNLPRVATVMARATVAA